MKVIDIIKNTEIQKKTLTSFEILPPARGNGISTLFEHLDILMKVNPPFVNVTYHRREPSTVNVFGEEIKHKSKRPGTIGISATIQQRYGVEAVPHLICGGFTKDETEDALIELSYLGVNNILALRGDGLVKDNKKFIPTKGGHSYSTELIEQVVRLNRGEYLDDQASGSPTQFCIGVAGYPEKHFEARSLEDDIFHLKKKIELGAEYVVTQMFFDNKHYFNFVKKCRELGVHVPIIPGLKPITRKKQLEILPKIFFTEIPDVFRRELEKCKDDKDCARLGEDWLALQIKELKAMKIPIIHFYTVGSVATPIMNAINRVF